MVLSYFLLAVARGTAPRLRAAHPKSKSFELRYPLHLVLAAIGRLEWYNVPSCPTQTTGGRPIKESVGLQVMLARIASALCFAECSFGGRIRIRTGMVLVW